MSQTVGSPMTAGNTQVQYTSAQIVAWSTASATNFINYCVQRNPALMLAYININYPTEPIRFTAGTETNVAAMETMITFLLRMYNQTPAAQQQHFLYTLGQSIKGTQPQQVNWTTPTDGQA